MTTTPPQAAAASDADSPLIEVRDVRKSYDAVHALGGAPIA